MSRDIAEFILRDPRYVRAEGLSVTVELLRSSDPAAKPVSAGLVDFSRNGIKVLSDVELAMGEEITAVVRDAGANIELKVLATVQWQRRTDNDKYSIGCQFVDAVDWEVLGDLFLSGVLDQQSVV